ncbi:MAG: carboxypeptidase regulatory-like domain-containing protein [Acidobacteriota bacterium]|nr:MAG: carboxypeptidase regulatory-like domain-containing protein [Acidobacteriota bacterium]
MKAITAALSCFLLIIAASLDLVESRGSAQKEDPRTFRELRPVFVPAFASGESDPVRDLAPAVPESWKKSGKMGRAEQQSREVPNKIPYRKQIESAVPDADRPVGTFAGAPMPAPSVSFEGLNSNDNFAAYGFRIVPPDTIGDVGPSHYVQAANALFRVFDKSGKPVTPPLKMSSLFASLGTNCSTRDDGDPIVLHDPLADRWILSQFCKAFPPFRQMIAVSKTSDPAGEYFVYEFVMPNVKLNDYPKLAVWPDAIYMSTDEFYGSDYAGTGVFAFDREKMLSGDPSAGYIYFDLASPTTMRIGGLLPVDLDGIVPPPAGSPGMFLGYTATEYGDPSDAVRLFEFEADFADPAGSTFSEAAGSPFSVPPFDPTSNPGRDDIPQPDPGAKLDSQSDRLMYRAAYTNRSVADSIVVNQTVRISAPGEPYAAGVRVHIFERPSGGEFAVRESTNLGDTDTSRFMAAAALDREGNLAVGYSTSNGEKRPAIVYSGRLEGDPPGQFRPEAALIEGDGVQTAFGFRWGDYTGLSPDPSDGCTFWITNQYYSLESQTESPFGWLTRIGSFRFPECEPLVPAFLSGTVTDSGTGLPIDGAVVSIERGFRRTSDAEGDYGPFALPAGTYTATVTARGYLPGTAAVDVSSGATLKRDFALEPTAVLEDSPIGIVSESCSTNGAVEPGESVTVAIPLRNTGARGVSNLVVSLSEGGGVEEPSGPQGYGSLPAGGGPVSREFSFTASSGLKCGAVLRLNLNLSDNDLPLGTVSIDLRAGREKIAFSEYFDSVQSQGLPEGWITSAEGAQLEWTSSSQRADSGRYSAFSPSPRQVGLNELVSPPIAIGTSEAELRFRNWYELETTFLRNRLYDGSVLEIRIGAGDWQDILEAGGSFRSGGYDLGLIDSCCQNPLGGRPGWSGRSGIDQEPEFIDSVVTLPPAAAGSEVRFRWRVGTDIGSFREGQYLDDITVADGYVCDCEKALNESAPFDFDGDGKTDASVFDATDEPSEPDFRIRRSTNGSEAAYFWGSAGDRPVNADYDGDGITDLAVFRPSSRVWFIFNSSDSTFRAVEFGISGDLAAVSDLDGDSLADVAVYRSDEGTWYYLKSSDGSFAAAQFGVDGDLPVPADYDGDGTDDLAVFRPSNGVWYVFGSSDGFLAVQFGVAGDKPVSGDFDGDGRADRVVFRPADSIWYVLGSEAGFSASQFGIATDKPLQADIDGDGRQDIGVYRPESSMWFFLRSSDSAVESFSFGTAGSTAVPGIFVR